MMAEIVNSLFLTYVATEYLLYSSSSRGEKGLPGLRRLFIRSRIIRIALVIVVTVNLLERLYGFFNVHDVISNLRVLEYRILAWIRRVPKIMFVGTAYVFCLYFDCQRVAKGTLHKADFALRVAMSTLKLAPAYPFCAVLISFGFLFVISAFEALHANVEILNNPIYFGTLYGPFSLVYWSVKSKVVEDFCQSLPIQSKRIEKFKDKPKAWEKRTMNFLGSSDQ